MPETTAISTSAATETALADRYALVRAVTRELAAPLSAEDAVAQSMPEASPVKWHLAHTTWFFEHFVLGHRGIDAVHPEWHRLFNSYYRSAGTFHARHARGLLTRPSLDEVLRWRGEVDARIDALLRRADGDADVAMRVTLGINHEQQHQELLLTDVKHLLWCNPLRPAYRELPNPCRSSGMLPPLRFLDGDSGVVEIGASENGFAYDNERPRHRVLLSDYAIADRLVSNAEFRDFIEDGGYRTPLLWMSEGWDVVEREGWRHPLYWSEDCATEFTLSGMKDIDPQAPVCHLSHFEADAFARWAGARLPREEEWEAFAARHGNAGQGNLLDRGALHPLAAEAGAMQLFGDVWEWTASPYVGYPGFRALEGSLGEYNGKFMSSQMVLRGGSCVTPCGHVRASYRNFFAPGARWQFSGLRLARDA